MDFLDFLKKPAQAPKVAADAEATQGQRSTMLVPQQASLRGGDPILVLLSDSSHQPSASGRYYLVYEGTNRRHLASCEVVPDCKGLFSRVPEHDRTEQVHLSLYKDSSEVASLHFTFTSDRLLTVACDIAKEFPRTPESLISLSSAATASCDTDRRLCSALRRQQLASWQPHSAADSEQQQQEQQLELDSVFHHLASANWLESLAQLLRAAGHHQFCLNRIVAISDGATVLQRVRDSRCRLVLQDTGKLHSWLEQLDNQADRQQYQEEAVVNVTSWPTPASTLVIMTTNKLKADTPLDVDIDLFANLENSHREEYYLLRSSRNQQSTLPQKETACAETAIGRSIEDLIAAQRSSSSSSSSSHHIARYAETGSVQFDSTGKYSVSHSMSQSVIVESDTESPIGKQQQQQQQHDSPPVLRSPTAASLMASRSVSTPTLYDDFMSSYTPPTTPTLDGRLTNEEAEFAFDLRGTAIDENGELPSRPSWPMLMQLDEQRNRKKRKSFLSKLGNSSRQKGKQKGFMLPVYDHDWAIVSAGKCAVCEEDASGILTVCRVCQLIVHENEKCRSQTVPCLRNMLDSAQSVPVATPTSPHSKSSSLISPVSSDMQRIRRQSHHTLPRNFANCEQEQAAAVAIGRKARANSVGAEPFKSINNNNSGHSSNNSSMDNNSDSPVSPIRSPISPSPATASSLSNHFADISSERLAWLQQLAAGRSASWASAQEKKSLKKCGDKLTKRCNILHELISTEINYLHNLRVLQAIFRHTLLQFSSAADAGIVESLFPQLDLIESLHSSLLDDLLGCDPPDARQLLQQLQRDSESSISNCGSVLCKHFASEQQWRAAYGEFCSQHTTALPKLLASLCCRSADFATVLRECERSKWAGRKTLQDYYLTMSQRLSKYKSLLPQINECSQQQPVDRNMQQACHELDSVLDSVNETVELRHNAHLLEQVVANFWAPIGETRLTQEMLRSRQLIHSGRVKLQLKEVKSPIHCYALLLNDMLVFLQEQQLSSSSDHSSSVKYSLITCSNRHLPVVSVAGASARLREAEVAKSKDSLFLLLSKPQPCLVTIICLSMEERNKWVRKFEQVRLANPDTDQLAQEAQQRVQIKSKAAGELLSRMELKDRDMVQMLNEKSQLWQQLVRLWEEPTDTHTSPPPLPPSPAQQQQQQLDTEQLSKEAIQQLGRLRLLLHHTAGRQDAAAAAAAAASLTRSASNAEEKSPIGVSLPRRADTFSGYEAKAKDKLSANANDNSGGGSNNNNEHSNEHSHACEEPLLVGAAVLQQSACNNSNSNSSSSNNNNNNNKGHSSTVSAASGGGTLTVKEKNRRPSVFDMMFRRSRENTSVSEDSGGGSDPDLRPPDADALDAVDRLQATVASLCRTVLQDRAEMARLLCSEAEQRQQLLAVRSSLRTEGQRSNDSLLESVRRQKSDLDEECRKFKDMRLREQARLDTRREELERREEELRIRLEEQQQQQQQLLLQPPLQQKRRASCDLQQQLQQPDHFTKSRSVDCSEQQQLSDSCGSSINCQLAAADAAATTLATRAQMLRNGSADADADADE